MCGIIGYVGSRPAKKVILQALARLEYRGYDSAGIAVCGKDGQLHWEKAAGKLSKLVEALKPTSWGGTVGIGHTRWATHGAPTRENAHPHFDCHNAIAVVHNGIVENHDALRTELRKKGHVFRSETDTETIVHLIESLYKGDPDLAVQRAIARLEGSFAVAVLFQKHPDRVYGARLYSPLVVGLAPDSTFIASDVPAILSHTRRVIYLDEGEIVCISRSGAKITTLKGAPVHRSPSEVSWTLEGAEKEGYAHFMLKEIHEQPKALRSALAGRIGPGFADARLGTLGLSVAQLKRFQRVIFVACGTAWHAGLTAKYAVEELAGLATDVALSSEFRYGNPVVDKRTLVVAVSQSGETADTLAAVRLAREKGATVLSVCNVVGASIPRACHGTIYTQAGPEIGVASTKAYVTQLACLDLLAIHLGRVRGVLKPAAARSLLSELARIPDKVTEILADDSAIRACAAKYKDVGSFMYIGRRYNFPNAYEGALKLKEISYVHAEGYCAGEMKHGPLALVTPSLPTVAICVESTVHEKMLSNIQEIRARGGILIAIANEGDPKIAALSDVLLTVPRTPEIFSPILTVVPLQLLAYHVAVARGCDVDQPRNLAKSVTVE